MVMNFVRDDQRRFIYNYWQEWKESGVVFMEICMFKKMEMKLLYDKVIVFLDYN